MNPATVADELHAQVLRFRAWSRATSSRPEAERGGSLECDYEDWSSLHGAVLAFLEHRPPSTWSETEANELVYAVARDNEIEYLVEEAVGRPESFVALAHRALSTGDQPQAMWQLADRLPAIAPHREVEPLLLRFVRDPDEYVRRRALLALGRMKSPRPSRSRATRGTRTTRRRPGCAWP